MQSAKEFDVLTEGNGTDLRGSGRHSQNSIEKLEGPHEVTRRLADSVLGWVVVGVRLPLHELGDEGQGLTWITQIVNEPARDLPVHRAAIDGAEYFLRDGYFSRARNPGKLYQAGLGREPRPGSRPRRSSNPGTVEDRIALVAPQDDIQASLRERRSSR